MTFPNYIISESYTIALNSSIMLDLYIQQVISILLCGQIYTAIAIEKHQKYKRKAEHRKDILLMKNQIAFLLCYVIYPSVQL